MITIANFGKILRELRKSNDLTQTELANDIGLAFSTISMYERGERKPDYETMEVIADYFNVSMDYLYGKSSIKNIYSITPSKKSTPFPIVGDIAAGYDQPAPAALINDKITPNHNNDQGVMLLHEDVKLPFDYPTDDFILTHQEKKIIKAYRAKPEMHESVRKLLDIDPPKD